MESGGLADILEGSLRVHIQVRDGSLCFASGRNCLTMNTSVKEERGLEGKELLQLTV